MLKRSGRFLTYLVIAYSVCHLIGHSNLLAEDLPCQYYCDQVGKMRNLADINSVNAAKYNNVRFEKDALNKAAQLERNAANQYQQKCNICSGLSGNSDTSNSSLGGNNQLNQFYNLLSQYNNMISSESFNQLSVENKAYLIKLKELLTNLWEQKDPSDKKLQINTINSFGKNSLEDVDDSYGTNTAILTDGSKGFTTNADSNIVTISDGRDQPNVITVDSKAALAAQQQLQQQRQQQFARRQQQSTQSGQITLSLLSPIALSSLSPIALSSLSPIALSSLSPIALSSLSPIALSSLSPIALSSLSPIALSSLSPIALSSLSPIALSSLSPIALSSLSPIALSSLSPIAIGPSAPIAIGF